MECRGPQIKDIVDLQSSKIVKMYTYDLDAIWIEADECKEKKKHSRGKEIKEKVEKDFHPFYLNCMWNGKKKITVYIV